MVRSRCRQRSQRKSDKYNRLTLAGMDIPDSIYEQKKAQENSRRMAEAPVPSLILSLSVSTVVTMLVATTYNIVDTYFVADIGENCVAAVGVMFSVMALIQAVGYTWGMGAGSEIARLLGAGNKKQAGQTLATAFAGSLISGAVMAAIFVIYKEDIIRLLGATDTITDQAEQYGIYIMAAAPVMCGAYVLGNVLRAEGQPYLAMAGIVAGGIANALLDWILIRIMGNGIAAAGLATLAGQSVSLVIMYVYVRSRLSVVRLDIGQMWKFKGAVRIVRTGMPSFLRQGLMCVASVLLSRSCRQYGDSALANITVANKIFAVIFAVLVGYGQGFAPVCGFACGAGLKSRVKRSLNFTMASSVAFMLLAGTVTYIWAERLCGMFIRDMELAAFSMRAHAISMPFAAVCLVMGMYYQALGGYGKATLISSLRQGIFFIPLIFWLPAGYGEYGVAVCQAAADVLSGLTAFVFWLICQRTFRTQKKNNQWL